VLEEKKKCAVLCKIRQVPTESKACFAGGGFEFPISMFERSEGERA
jgi:hypothetical protein